MQHLNSQTNNHQTRKWNFDEKWNNVEHALLKQNEQRSEDVENSKQNIQNKINNLMQLENNKVSVMNDNIRYLKKEAEILERNTQTTIDKAKDFYNQYESRTGQFINEYLQNSHLFAQKILAYSKNKCNQVERKLNVVDQSIKRKTQEQMKQIRESSINHIKNMMESETQSQKGHLQSLNTLVNDSLKNMRQTLKNYDKQCLKSETKLQEQIHRLDKEMFKMIEKEKKQGDITYDCLLKLVEDSCSKIQEIKLRG